VLHETPPKGGKEGGKEFMGRSIHKLSDRFCKTTKPGRYHDGGGLILVVTSPTARSWLFRWNVGGKRLEMGLGSLHAVSLAEARRQAAEARADRAQGRDPKVVRASRRAGALSFGEAADKLIESMQAGWRNAVHRRQWQQTLLHHAAPLRPIPVSEITAEDVAHALKPIWLNKPETAARTRGRIERVLHWATVQRFRTGPNPAMLKGMLEHLLPKQPAVRKRVKHHRAMPYAEIPDLLAQLRTMRGIAPLALEFTILVAARTGETTGAMWGEISFDEAVWEVPGVRMKAGLAHRVPLAPRPLEILQRLYEARTSPFVFPGWKRNTPLSNMAMLTLLQQRLGLPVTVHGFRSGFRQWCAEQTNFPREIAEAALAHTNPDETEAAYQRSDLLERRRRLMGAWAAYCSKPPVSGVVLPIRR
jgi:integrase